MCHATKTLGLSALVLALIAGCSTAPTSSSNQAALHSEVQSTIATARAVDPSLDRFFNTAAGYAVFPNVGKGGYIVGGAYGQGMLFEDGRFTSYCDLTQGTVGLQIGGQTYSEIIFFETEESLSDFKAEQLALAAQASAVALQVGAAANANYNQGVAVFTMGHGGLMAEASIGGQKFNVIPKENVTFASDRRDYNVNANMPYRDELGETRTNNQDVYGYAGSETDSSWRDDSDYNRRFDSNQSRTISGEVISVSEFSPSSGASRGQEVRVRTDDGQTYVVHLGPTRYMNQQDRIRIREGDDITVVGSQMNFENERNTLMAQVIRTEDGQVLELRDSQGRSRWNLDTRSNSINNNQNRNNDLDNNNNRNDNLDNDSNNLNRNNDRELEELDDLQDDN